MNNEHTLKSAIQTIASIPANGNSEPDVMAAALDRAKSVAHAALNGLSEPVARPDHWADDPDYPVSDWQDEVADDSTRLGYADWVKAQRDSAE